MDWINLRTSIIRMPEYVGSAPEERATWFNVLAYCVELENGGRVAGGAKWKDRQWQQTCGVTLREVNKASKLFTFKGDDVIVWAYPIDKEKTVKEKREAGREGGSATSQAKTEAARENGAKGGRPKTQAQTEAETQANGENNPSENPTEGEREGKGKGIGNGKESFAPTGVVADGNSENPPPPPKKQERPRDLIFEALAAVENVKLAELTPPGRGALNKARSLIVTASPDVTPAEIARREAILRKMYPNATMSASALAKHWARCGTVPLDPASYAAAERRRLEREAAEEAEAKAKREADLAQNTFADALIAEVAAAAEVAP